MYQKYDFNIIDDDLLKRSLIMYIKKKIKFLEHDMTSSIFWIGGWDGTMWDFSSATPFLLSVHSGRGGFNLMERLSQPITGRTVADEEKVREVSEFEDTTFTQGKDILNLLHERG